METNKMHSGHATERSHYKKLAAMIALSFIAMYFLMYAMVDSTANVIHNINQVYMAALMTAAMVPIELAIMGSMYKNKLLNAAILVISGVVLVLSFFFIRKQTAVGDKQFLKSMIPHHAAAVLMVKETKLQDPEIRQLAQDIIIAQEKEIAFMKAKLKQHENK